MRSASKLLAGLLIALAATSAHAEVAGNEWRHAKSGISLPLAFGDMRLAGERDLSSGQGYDVMAQFGTDDDPVTVYVYRSSYPNAALWFERIRHAMKRSVGLPTENVAPRTFELGLSDVPNGLREELAIGPGSEWKTTGVALAQMGEWLVKVRASSKSLDEAGVAGRIDRILAAMRFAAPVGSRMNKPLRLEVPGPCPNNPDLQGSRLTGDLSDESAAAAANGIVAYAEARGAAGLAAEPARWCREDTDIPAEHASVYRERNGDAWVALVGDSGMSVAARRLEAPAGTPAAAATFANNPSGTSVVALFNAVPDPDATVVEALPIAAGRAEGIARITVEPREGK